MIGPIRTTWEDNVGNESRVKVCDHISLAGRIVGESEGYEYHVIANVLCQVCGEHEVMIAVN